MMVRRNRRRAVDQVLVVVVVLLAMGMAVDQGAESIIVNSESEEMMAGSTFMNCYTPCFVLCYLTPAKTASTCALECLRDCIIPAAAHGDDDDRKLKAAAAAEPHHHQSTSTTKDDNNHLDLHLFCKLGCAVSSCTHISTPQNPGGEKVERCVGSCSKMCTKGYYSSSPP